MQKVFFVVLGFVAVAAIAILLFVQSRPLDVSPALPTRPEKTNAESEVPPEKIKAPEAAPPALILSSYRDGEGFFEIDYPHFYEVATTSLPTEFGTIPPSVRIESPEEERAGTNLIQSAVFVGVSSRHADVERCSSPADGETKLGSLTVGENEFVIYTRDGTFAESRFQSVRYRTKHQQRCVEAVLVMRFGPRESGQEGTVREFDRSITLERLKAIFYSLRLR